MNSEQILKHVSTELFEELLAGAQIIFYYTENRSNNFILLKRKLLVFKEGKTAYFATYQLTTEENGSKYILVSTIGEKMTDRQAIRIAKILTKQVTATNPLFKIVN